MKRVFQIEVSNYYYEIRDFSVSCKYARNISFCCGPTVRAQSWSDLRAEKSKFYLEFIFATITSFSSTKIKSFFGFAVVLPGFAF